MELGDEQEAAFQAVKELISKAPVLTYFKSEEPLVVQCDSSQYGLGAALLQNGKPIDFRSRSLTDAEQRYAQIEKELLAVVFAMERFNDYTFGRFTTVVSDHKPLASIVSKPLNQAPRRLQRMLIRLQRYNYRIVYKPGAEMYIADTLSRACLPEQGNDHMEFTTVHAVQELAVPSERLEEIQTHCKEDPVIKTLKKAIMEGWPESRRALPKELTPYYNYRDELTTNGHLVFKGEKLVIPKSLQKAMLKRIHSAHLGINQCLCRAREMYFWPGMTSQIRDYVSSCAICQAYATQQQKEPMNLHEIPERPWQMLAADLFTFEQREYLVVVDYYSDFFEVDHLATTSSQAVINKLRSHFARHGIPDILVSDNGPQFTSREFEKFARKWEFQHKLTSPYHSQSNGKAEAAVKMVKRLMTEAKEEKEDPYLYILEKRNTPTPEMESSPAQRLFGRRLKTLLPTTKKLLEPEKSEPSEVHQKLGKRMLQQKKYYDQGSRSLGELQAEQNVWVQPTQQGKKWKKGKVVKCLGNRSYEVDLDGVIYRRNRIHLRPLRGHEISDEQICGDTVENRDHQLRSGTCYQTEIQQTRPLEKREDVRESDPYVRKRHENPAEKTKIGPCARIDQSLLYNSNLPRCKRNYEITFQRQRKPTPDFVNRFEDESELNRIRLCLNQPIKKSSDPFVS